MVLRKTVYIFLVLCLSCNNLVSQQDLGFGEWESHLPYQRGLVVTQSPEKIYYATDWSVMAINKSDFSLEFISKVEGMSALGVSKLNYDPYTESLVIIYLDSNIDIITETGIINIADIKNNTGINGDKRINDVFFSNEKIAYFSTGFGVVSFDMENYEFGFTTQMGLQVFDATIDDKNILYAGTEEGLYSIDLNQNFNFGDFGNWKFIGEESGLPLLYAAAQVAFYNEMLFLITENQLLRQNEGGFDTILDAAPGERYLFLNPDGEELLLGIREEAKFKSTITYINKDLQISSGASDCGNFTNYAVMEESGRIWFADDWSSFRYAENKDAQCQRFTAPSPFSHSASELKVEDGKLYIASGGVSDGFNFQENRDGIYIYENGQWLNHNEGNNAFLKSTQAINLFVIEPDPRNDDLFYGSFYSGLYKADMNHQNVELYDSNNSPIKGTAGTPDIEKVGGLAFDLNNNLWISVYESDKPLVALSNEGTFHSFSINASNRIAQIEIDDFGYKWIQVTGAAGGILIYDDNGTVKDPSDDRQRLINTSNSNLKSNSINCIHSDLNGDVWVGTAKGPIIFECGADPFDLENCLGSIRIVLEDSIAAELLVTEDVRDVETDGGNRKWIGTRNGIFVQSADGREKVHRFTTENSPLFDDNIIDMAFDGSTGVMYIATDKGLQSYQTLTTSGSRRHKTNAYAFPNPVRPEFDGTIAIRGLANDATIKITDINGQLVHESSALGGQANWDGRDYNGRKVSSGVYLVFSTSSDIFEDPDTAVIKLLIVR
jgi:hypothetical protein